MYGALHPLLQSISELKIVKSTHGVLTNARPDHLDVMGPKERNVAEALASTVPVDGIYFSSEEKNTDILEYAANDRSSKIHTITKADIDNITDEEISKFCYSEFKISKLRLQFKLTTFPRTKNLIILNQL